MRNKIYSSIVSIKNNPKSMRWRWWAITYAPPPFSPVRIIVHIQVPINIESYANKNPQNTIDDNNAERMKLCIEKSTDIAINSSGKQTDDVKIWYKNGEKYVLREREILFLFIRSVAGMLLTNHTFFSRFSSISDLCFAVNISFYRYKRSAQHHTTVTGQYSEHL